MQYRSPVGRGPSGNTCPRCALQSLHFTSVRSMPSELSPASTTFSLAIGAQKLGHPVPESNLVDELNNARSQQIQRKIPLPMLVPCRPGIGHLRVSVAGNLVGVPPQLRLPLGIGLDHLRNGLFAQVLAVVAEVDDRDHLRRLAPRPACLNYRLLAHREERQTPPQPSPHRRERPCASPSAIPRRDPTLNQTSCTSNHNFILHLSDSNQPGKSYRNRPSRLTESKRNRRRNS